MSTDIRITSDDLHHEIASEHYFTAGQAVSIYNPTPLDSPLHRLTICVLVLKNGFTVTGESACVSPRAFDTDKGRKAARAAALQKLTALMAFSMADAIETVRTKRVRYRCAESGEFVTRGYAEAHPTTTVGETVKPPTQRVVAPGFEAFGPMGGKL